MEQVELLMMLTDDIFKVGWRAEVGRELEGLYWRVVDHNYRSVFRGLLL